MESIGERYKKAVTRTLCYVLCILMTGIAGWHVQAQDLTGRTEGHDSVYVSGTYQPRAATEQAGFEAFDADEDDSFLNCYRSGKTAYYGAQLTAENERSVYTVLAEKSRRGQIRSADSYGRSITVKLAEKVTLPSSKSTESAAYRKLYNEVGKAIDAFLFDYTENYWVYGYRWAPVYSGKSSSICSVDIWFIDYYDGIRSENAMTEAELNTLLKKINGTNRYEIVKQAYEEVIKLVTYPSGTNLDYLPYHTITGGLLEKYGHKGVCDCYARIFRLLCQKKGSACILVTGGSEVVNGEVLADHIWNYVQMGDGEWYLVDCTWDDQEADVPEMTHFLAGSETEGFFSETVGQSHLPVGRFTYSAYKPFTVPKLSVNAYTDQIRIETEPQKAELNMTSLIMKEGDIKELSAKVVPNTFPTDKLEWKSSNSSIVSITDFGSAGKIYITGLKAGKADITVTYNNKVLASCHVIVNAKQSAAVYKIKLNTNSLPMQVKTSTKALKVISYSPGDSIREWKSSNSKCVKVDKKTGKLTALRTGTATITVVSRKGAKAFCKVKVQKGRVATGKLTLKKTVLELKKGKSQKIQVFRTPLTANDKLSYKSSNKKVATVNSKGTVKAKKKGTAVITVRSASGKTVKLTIKVK